MDKPTVFISYKREKRQIVDELVDRIKERADIKRDTKEIGAWDSIVEFMNSIGQRDFAILVISDSYLKSAACMYEVLQLMKNDNWISKTMIMLVEDIKIFGTKEQLSYVKFWNDEYNNISKLIKSLPPESVSAQAEDLKKISRIKDEVGDFLHIVADRNIPAEDIYNQINKRLENYPSRNDTEDKTTCVESVKLGLDAISLLITICNGDGTFLVSTSLESFSLTINGDNFLDCSSLDNRTVAKWTDVIRKLEYYNLIESSNGRVYCVTQNGYKASDDLEKQIGKYKVRCTACHYHGASDKSNECPICKSVIGIKQIVLDEIRKNQYISRAILSKRIGCTQNVTNRILKELEEQDLIVKIGNTKTGYWKLKE